jgi:hypothetical protein
MEVRDQALIGGVATLIVRRLNAGGAARLPELLPTWSSSPSPPMWVAKRPSAKPPPPA